MFRFLASPEKTLRSGNIGPAFLHGSNPLELTSYYTFSIMHALSLSLKLPIIR